MENLMALLNRILGYLQLNMAWTFHYNIDNDSAAISAATMALQSFVNCNDTNNIAYCRALIAQWGGVVPAPSPVPALPSNEAFIQALAGINGSPQDIQFNGGAGTLLLFDRPYEDGDVLTVIPFGFDKTTGASVNVKIPESGITKDGFTAIPDKDCRFYSLIMKDTNPGAPIV